MSNRLLALSLMSGAVFAGFIGTNVAYASEGKMMAPSNSPMMMKAPPKQEVFPLAFGLKLSSLGAGVEAVYNIMEYFSAGIVVNYYHGGRYIQKDVAIDNTLNYPASLKAYRTYRMSNYGIMLNWHPFGGGFRITLGGLKDNNSIQIKAANMAGSSDNFTVGATSYSGNHIGAISGPVTYARTVAPYVGVAYGYSPEDADIIGGILELGLLFQGTASAALASSYNSTGAISAGDLALADAAVVRDKAIKRTKTLPVLGLGFSIRL